MSWVERAGVPLVDGRVLLRPVRPEDREGLHAIAMDPAIWRYFVSAVKDDADFDRLFDSMLADHTEGSRVVFVIVDRADQRLAGSTSFGNLSERDLRLEIGWSWLGVHAQGTGINRHAKSLLLAHAFDTLMAERVEFKTDERNLRARQALLKVGAVEEGTLRSYNPMPDGRRRNAVYYSIIRQDWPLIRAQLMEGQPVSAGKRAEMIPGVARVPYVRAYGAPYELGRAHGARVGRLLREFVGHSLCRLNLLLPEPVSLASLRPQLEAYGSEIASATPNLYEELRGLADGAEITFREALLLQLRREILGFRRIPTMGDCTTYARVGGSDPGSTVLAQTIDLNGNLDDYITVMRVGAAIGGRESLVLTFGGLLGYLGVNSDGLAIGINLVLGGTWRPGLPPYLAIRHLLDTAGTVDEGVALLRGLPLSSSRTITLCDRTKTACVEIVDDDLRVVEGDQSTHTNHFLDPDFAALDELNVFARNSSVHRLDVCRSQLSRMGRMADAEEQFELLSQPPLCVPDNGDPRRERTVGAVVIFPERGELHLRPGNPALSRTRTFTLH